MWSPALITRLFEENNEIEKQNHKDDAALSRRKEQNSQKKKAKLRKEYTKCERRRAGEPSLDE